MYSVMDRVVSFSFLHTKLFYYSNKTFLQNLVIGNSKEIRCYILDSFDDRSRYILKCDKIILRIFY